MDPKIQEIFDRLGIKLDSTAAGLGKLNSATKDQVKSATAQALAQAKAHKDLLKSIEDQIKSTGNRNRVSKQELETIAKKIKQEEELFDQAAASAKQQKDLDDKRTDGFKKLFKDIGALGSSAINASSSFYASDKAFTAVSGTLDLVGGALKTTIEAAGLALSGVTVLGFSAGKATEGLSKLAIGAVDVGVKVAQMQLEMAQGYTDSFDKLAMTGMTFGGNISNMAASAHAAGLDLRTYSEFVVRNVEALSQMGGTLEQASARVTKMGRAAVDGNNKLLLMYGGFDGVNDALAGYQQLLARTGTDTVANQDRITAGSVEYLKNLKLLSELTGKDVKTLQKEQDDAMRDLAFRQKMREIEIENPKKYAKIMSDVNRLQTVAGKDATNLYKERVALDGDIISKSQLRMLSLNESLGDFTDIMYKSADLEGEARDTVIKQGIANFQQQYMVESKNKKELTQLAQYTDNELLRAELETQRQLMDTQAARLAYDKASQAAAANLNSTLDDDAEAVAKLKKENIKGRIEVDKVIASNMEKTASIAKQLTELQVGLITTFGPKLTNAVNLATDALLRLAKSIPGGPATPTSPVGPAPDNKGAARSLYEQRRKQYEERSGGPAAPAPAPASAPGPTVTSKGLILKPGAEDKGESSDKLYTAAQLVSEMLGGDYKYFSGLKDRDGDSAHASGRAFDLVLNDPKQYSATLAKIKYTMMPDLIKFAQFEPKGHVNKNGSVSSGDHIHAEVNAAQGGVIASSTGGTNVNVGEGGQDELITPLKNGKLPGMDELIDKVTEMISVLKDQRDISERTFSAIQ